MLTFLVLSCFITVSNIRAFHCFVIEDHNTIFILSLIMGQNNSIILELLMIIETLQFSILKVAI